MRSIPQQRGSHRLGVARSDDTRLGYIRFGFDSRVDKATLLFMSLEKKGLRKKTAQPSVGGLEDHLKHSSAQPDLFGSSDAIVRHVLEVLDRNRTFE